MTKNYTELSKLKTLDARLAYLKCENLVGDETLGSRRYLVERFYKSDSWKKVRGKVIARDYGCELGLEGFDISDQVIVHHINPITVEDLLAKSEKLVDPENLICCSRRMHDAIHYGALVNTESEFVTRRENDTCPWKR